MARDARTRERHALEISFRKNDSMMGLTIVAIVKFEAAAHDEERGGEEDREAEDVFHGVTP
jgi:hypothetical protein